VNLFVEQHRLIFYFFGQSGGRDLLVRQQNNYGFTAKPLRPAGVSVFQRKGFAFDGEAAARFAHFERSRLSRWLRRFEAERKPVIEAYQAAAEESMLWFENAKDFMQLAPIELAYVLMTRSGRIDHETLRRRDPNFIALYEGRSETKS